MAGDGADDGRLGDDCDDLSARQRNSGDEGEPHCRLQTLAVDDPRPRRQRLEEEVHEEMAREEVYLDPERLAALKKELPELEAKLARLNEEWEGWIE